MLFQGAKTAFAGVKDGLLGGRRPSLRGRNAAFSMAESRVLCLWKPLFYTLSGIFWRTKSCHRRAAFSISRVLACIFALTFWHVSRCFCLHFVGRSLCGRAARRDVRPTYFLSAAMRIAAGIPLLGGVLKPENTVVRCHNVRVRVCIFPCFFLLFLCKSTTFA